MKKTSYSIIPLILALIIYGCSSSINVVNNWSSGGSNDLNKKKILVITRTPDQKARAAFEDEITKQLKSKGINAEASHIKYPNFEPNAELTEERKAKIKAILDEEKYGGIILTVLKDKLKNIRSTEAGGYEAGQSLAAYYPPYIPVYSYGFYGAYYSPYYFSSYYLYNTKTYDQYGTYIEKAVETQTSYSYVLETLVYDLGLDADKQLVAFVTTRIDEPDNIKGTAKTYTKKIIESFK